LWAKRFPLEDRLPHAAVVVQRDRGDVGGGRVRVVGPVEAERVVPDVDAAHHLPADRGARAALEDQKVVEEEVVLDVHRRLLGHRLDEGLEDAVRRVQEHVVRHHEVVGSDLGEGDERVGSGPVAAQAVRLSVVVVGRRAVQDEAADHDLADGGPPGELRERGVPPAGGERPHRVPEGVAGLEVVAVAAEKVEDSLLVADTGNLPDVRTGLAVVLAGGDQDADRLGPGLAQELAGQLHGLVERPLGVGAGSLRQPLGRLVGLRALRCDVGHVLSGHRQRWDGQEGREGRSRVPEHSVLPSRARSVPGPPGRAGEVWAFLFLR
jgi:hypothetical protein